MTIYLPQNFSTQPATTSDNLWVFPPIVDLCANLREPGSKQHGTLASEGRSAYQNGILHVVTPPTYDPIIQDGAMIDGLKNKARQDGGIYLHVLGALTQNLAGEQPANLLGLKQGGAIAVSNGRRAFASDRALLSTLEYAKTFDLKVFFYPDEPSLSKGGVAHEGYIASYHGLQGIPWLAETVALAKQILMVEETGVCAHFSQLTCRTSLDLIRFAKSRNLPVTCDVAMHQLFLTDDDLIGYNANAHVIPPLRSKTDQKALQEGLKDGTIDAICSHHEPLSDSAKAAPFADSMSGMSTFDTFVVWGCELVAKGILTPQELVQKICLNPAKIAGVDDYATIGGYVVIDPNYKWTLTEETMTSQGKNTVMIGREMTGKVIETHFD